MLLKQPENVEAGSGVNCGDSGGQSSSSFFFSFFSSPLLFLLVCSFFLFSFSSLSLSLFLCLLSHSGTRAARARARASLSLPLYCVQTTQLWPAARQAGSHCTRSFLGGCRQKSGGLCTHSLIHSFSAFKQAKNKNKKQKKAKQHQSDSDSATPTVVADGDGLHCCLLGVWPAVCGAR